MSTDQSTEIHGVLDFLACRTPRAWFDAAPEHLPTLLVDHANCEKKAAGTALNMLYRYVDRCELLQRLSRLAREELRHFEQVLAMMRRLQIPYQHVPAGRYAGTLRAGIATSEPTRLVDMLLVGAIVEARSCERFAGLVEVLPEPVRSLYERLVTSEARHFAVYLDLAERVATQPIAARLGRLLDMEAQLVTASDEHFRFHSGPPRRSTPALED